MQKVELNPHGPTFHLIPYGRDAYWLLFLVTECLTALILSQATSLRHSGLPLVGYAVQMSPIVWRALAFQLVWIGPVLFFGGIAFIINIGIKVGFWRSLVELALQLAFAVGLAAPMLAWILWVALGEVR